MPSLSSERLRELYDRLEIKMPRGGKARWRDAAEKEGITLSEMIRLAVEERLAFSRGNWHSSGALIFKYLAAALTHERSKGWLPIVGDVRNITLTQAEADEIVRLASGGETKGETSSAAIAKDRA